MTVLSTIPPADAAIAAVPRQRGMHRRVDVPLQRAAAATSHRRMNPALHGAASAAYTVVARVGSLTTLAAMLLLGGALAGATDGPAPAGAATATTLQGR